MNARALVVGESLIDEVIESGGARRHPGGSPANVALGLARLRVDTRFHTAIGDDHDGELIRGHLVSSGVQLTAESVTSAPTSTATATLAADGSATYQFALTWNPRPLDDLGAPEVIHTGSLGALLEPGSRTVSDILQRGRAGGALITFDPNIRPTLLPDSRAARDRFTAVAVMSHITKLSDEDAEYLFPGRSLDYVADALLRAGVSIAAITRGGNGAYLVSGSDRITVPPVATSVADTVGAGDSFMAAMLWALAFSGDGWDGGPVSSQRLEDVGATAARAAAITVSRHGADLPALSDIESNRPAA